MRWMVIYKVFGLLWFATTNTTTAIVDVFCVMHTANIPHKFQIQFHIAVRNGSFVYNNIDTTTVSYAKI